ncbi:MAG: hypothetical protein DI628_06095 [Blastochloris viridis]|uniref:Uncharacterized protein n=1 Tax=Blastochloris viridis TaxID=1079 RepID=A0A6N4RB38_BLAVI|nr:MAG: hypothetical protein DI628_06095 [Blastochloris viridis]
MKPQQVNRPTNRLNAKRRPADWHLRRLLMNEEAFLARATVHDITCAVLYFREQASRAQTPQLRDFYLDRANQFAFHGAADMRIHSSGR